MYVIIIITYNIIRRVLRTELVAVAHLKDVGDVGVPTHLTFLIKQKEY